MEESFIEAFESATFWFQISGLQLFSINSLRRKSTKMSTKFKLILTTILLFFALLIGLMIFTIAWDIEHDSKDIESSLNIFRLFLWSTLTVQLLHSFFMTPTAKLIFSKCKQVMKVFENNLNFDMKCSKFADEFKTFLLRTEIFFGFVSLSLLVSIYVLNGAFRAFIATFYVVLPYYFMKLFYQRFNFLIRLVDFNIKCMVKVMDRFTSSETPTNVYGKPEKSCEVYHTVVSLKEIYGMVWEVTQLTNSLCGPSMVIQILFTILSNTSAAYKLFLATKGLLPLTRVGSD